MGLAYPLFISDFSLFLFDTWLAGSGPFSLGELIRIILCQCDLNGLYFKQLFAPRRTTRPSISLSP